MNSQFDPQRPTYNLVDEEQPAAKTSPNIFFVTQTYSIQRRANTALAITKQTPKYESVWLPDRIVQFTVRSGFSSTTLFGGLLLASLAAYGTFTIVTIAMWDWLSTHSLAGAASLAMIFGAQAIIGILFSVIEENDPVRLVSRFTQSVGALLLYASVFLIGGWLSTQWLRSELIPFLGKSTATFISIVTLCLTVQLILNGLIRTYRATKIR